ncbi:DUF3099 domain-containing protein [Aquipuribacter hungaricus]|uniref:DUF3099 domain-containing protein n=1 Tax=Aquipuribacter hungaricus TaxID=545624 RepID=A0ABV7WAC2_9MICO
MSPSTTASSFSTSQPGPDGPQSSSPQTSPQTGSPYTAGHGEVFVLPAEDVQVVSTRDVDTHDLSVQRVTSARGSHSDDVGRRMRTYAISMGIRTLCVLGAILSFPHWWAWLFVPGAVVLPYVAVVLANVGGERVPVGPAAVAPASAPLPVLRTTREV